MGRIGLRAQSSASRINAITATNETTGHSVATGPTSTVPLNPEALAAAFNATFHWDTASGLPTHILDLVGETIRGVPVRPQGANTPGTVRWQIDAGVEITPHKGVIYYNFADSAHSTGMYNRPAEGFSEGAGYSPFTEAQRAAGRVAMHLWDDLIAPTFVETNGTGKADISLANTYTGPAQAWAYTPYDYVGALGNFAHRYGQLLSDVWIADPRVNGSNGQLLPGFYGLQTLEHEIGHSLGLSHPGNYNFGDDTDGDGVPDPINYATDAQYFQDSRQFTIMSYFDAEETGAQNVDWNTLRYVYASTPMVDDVFVMQQKYGADMTTRAGNTTYGFNATADVWNPAMSFHEGEMGTIFTIWDAGGTDTLDLSGYYTDSIIDLREGAYSSAGGWGAYDPSLIGLDPGTMNPADVLAIINANNDDAGLPHRNAPAGQPADYFYQIYFNGGMILRNPDGTPILDDDGNEILINDGVAIKDFTGTGPKYLMEQNIGIAYGAIIENAIGGHGDDRINGNQANNSFTGGDGADTFIIADYSGVLPTPGGTGSKTVVDMSVDTITDFHTGEDKIDLTSFGTGTVSGLSYDGQDLHFSANGHSYTVHLLGAAINLGADVLVG